MHWMHLIYLIHMICSLNAKSYAAAHILPLSLLVLQQLNVFAMPIVWSIIHTSNYNTIHSPSAGLRLASCFPSTFLQLNNYHSLKYFYDFLIYPTFLLFLLLSVWINFPLSFFEIFASRNEKK